MKAGFWEILLILVLVLILFGHSKIPDLAKNIANGINVFKKELKSKKNGTAVDANDKTPNAKAKVAKKTTAKKTTKPAAKSVKSKKK